MKDLFTGLAGLCLIMASIDNSGLHSTDQAMLFSVQAIAFAVLAHKEK